MNAEKVCKALGVTPGYLAGVLTREVAYQHEALAKQAMEEGAELGGFGLQHIANLLHLIGELTRAEAERSSGGGAKEATLAATPTDTHRTVPRSQQEGWTDPRRAAWTHDHDE